MKKKLLAVLMIFGLMVAGFALVGCQEQGPAEEAGEAIDDAVDNTGDAMEEVGDDIEDAVDGAGDAMEEAGDDIEDAVDDATDGH